jgi:hypothetical protein
MACTCCSQAQLEETHRLLHEEHKRRCAMEDENTQLKLQLQRAKDLGMYMYQLIICWFTNQQVVQEHADHVRARTFATALECSRPFALWRMLRIRQQAGRSSVPVAHPVPHFG